MRAEERRTDAALDVAGGLLDSLAAGDGEGARALATRAFRWFGREITREDWEGGALVTFFSGTPMTVGALRVIDRAVLDLFSQPELAEIFDGAVDARDLVVLADVTRGDREVTVALVVTTDQTETMLVARAVDPAVFVERSRALGTAGRA